MEKPDCAKTVLMRVIKRVTEESVVNMAAQRGVVVEGDKYPSGYESGAEEVMYKKTKQSSYASLIQTPHDNRLHVIKLASPPDLLFVVSVDTLLTRVTNRIRAHPTAYSLQRCPPLPVSAASLFCGHQRQQ